jgi:hypothetical protein
MYMYQLQDGARATVTGPKREVIPLFRHGHQLLCLGDCITINTEESDMPFVAQLLAYDRHTGYLTVRWLYRAEVGGLVS